MTAPAAALSIFDWKSEPAVVVQPALCVLPLPSVP